MNIAPQDLGDTFCKVLMHRRGPISKPIVPPRISGSVALASLTALILSLLLQWPYKWGYLEETTDVLLLITTIIAAPFYVTEVLTKSEQKKLRDAASECELAELHDGLKDALAKNYLDLVLAIREVPVTPGTAAEQEVRGAIRALGAAIDSLPPPEKELVTDDPGALRLDAERLAAEAEVETDPVVLASLRRRADSLTRRAETAARTRLLLRRNGALREEVAEQIGALRTNLTAFRVGGEQAAQEMTGLAASIQRVTIEANAITAARDEIDALLSAPPGAFSSLAAQTPLSIRKF